MPRRQTIRICDELPNSTDRSFARVTYIGFYTIAHYDKYQECYCADCANEYSEDIRYSRVIEDNDHTILCDKCNAVIWKKEKEIKRYAKIKYVKRSFLL